MRKRRIVFSHGILVGWDIKTYSCILERTVHQSVFPNIKRLKWTNSKKKSPNENPHTRSLCSFHMLFTLPHTSTVLVHELTKTFILSIFYLANFWSWWFGPLSGEREEVACESRGRSSCLLYSQETLYSKLLEDFVCSYTPFKAEMKKKRRYFYDFYYKCGLIFWWWM